MIREELFNWLSNSTSFNLEYSDFARHNELYNKVMGKLISRSSRTKIIRKVALRYLVSLNSYNTFLEDWASTNNIPENDIYKSITLFDRIDLTSPQIINFLDNNLKKDLLTHELNNSSYNLARESILINQIEKIFTVDELNYILYFMNNNCFFLFRCYCKNIYNIISFNRFISYNVF